MKNINANVDAFSTSVYEIKKYILNRSMKKINDILEHTRKIRKMNAEFYGRLDTAPQPETDAEQEQHAKKINDFQRGIGKRWGEIWLEKEEIFTIIDMLYELSKNRKKYPDLAEQDVPSWVDIRREIETKMKKIICNK